MEEHRLRVFEDGTLRKVLGPKMDEVPRKCRKPHSEERYDLYCTPNVIRVIE
jgi:hypothetical protein